MTHWSAAAATGSRPAWLEEAPSDLKPLLEMGFGKFGDDPAAIAAWITRLHDYKQFWSLVDGQPDDLEDRYARDDGLRVQISQARACPERRVPRPARRTA